MTPTYETIEACAARLSLKPHALRARCRRAARKVGRDVRAYLGDGVTAVKIGGVWRVRLELDSAGL